MTVRFVRARMPAIMGQRLIQNASELSEVVLLLNFQRRRDYIERFRSRWPLEVTAGVT